MPHATFYASHGVICAKCLQMAQPGAIDTESDSTTVTCMNPQCERYDVRYRIGLVKLDGMRAE